MSFGDGDGREAIAFGAEFVSRVFSGDSPVSFFPIGSFFPGNGVVGVRVIFSRLWDRAVVKSRAATRDRCFCKLCRRLCRSEGGLYTGMAATDGASAVESDAVAFAAAPSRGAWCEEAGVRDVEPGSALGGFRSNCLCFGKTASSRTRVGT